MLTKGIKLENFKYVFKNSLVKKNLKIILNENNKVLSSLGNLYKDSYKTKDISKYKKYLNYRVIGMGGSSLGTKAIYDFLKKKIKKNFYFFDNLQSETINLKKKKYVNLIVSKSGNTVETIVNSNLLISKSDKNIFITEKKNSFLNSLAEKLKADIIHHNNYIGGRYSVLSEVGMLPVELMGLNPNNFRKFNNLIKNKKFINALVLNVGSLVYFVKKKKFNSIIINYDEKTESIFKWYQQLVAESLGKKKTGILPVISNMPRDNHSVMQLYLDGFNNNFFTFFYVNDQKSSKIKNNLLLNSQSFLKNKSVKQISLSQKKATENVFRKKKNTF